MKKGTTAIALALSATLALSLAGCKSKQPMLTPTTPSETTTSDTATAKTQYPLTIGSTKILLGETKLQALYDAGYTIEAPADPQTGSAADGQTNELAGDQEINANQSIENCYVMKDGVKQAEVNVLGGQEKGSLSDATIMSFLMDRAIAEPTEVITFDDIDLNELTMDAFTNAVDGEATLYGTETAIYQQDGWDMDAQWDESGALTSIRVSID